jgi:hypothetical protein
MAPQQPLRSLRLGAPAPATGHAACRCSAAAPLFGKRLPLVVAFPRSGGAVAHCSAVQQESSASTAGTYNRLLVATSFFRTKWKVEIFGCLILNSEVLFLLPVLVT